MVVEVTGMADAVAVADLGAALVALGAAAVDGTVVAVDLTFSGGDHRE